MGKVLGMVKKMQMQVTHNTATMAMGYPARPRLKGPGTNSALLASRQTTGMT